MTLRANTPRQRNRLADLQRRWAQEARARGDDEAAQALEREADALAEMREEPDDDQPWGET